MASCRASRTSARPPTSCQPRGPGPSPPCTRPTPQEDAGSKLQLAASRSCRLMCSGPAAAAHAFHCVCNRALLEEYHVCPAAPHRFISSICLAHGSTCRIAASLPACLPATERAQLERDWCRHVSSNGTVAVGPHRGPGSDGSVSDTCGRVLQGQPAHERLVQGALHQRVQVGRIIALQRPRKALESTHCSYLMPPQPTPASIPGEAMLSMDLGDGAAVGCCRMPRPLIMMSGSCIPEVCNTAGVTAEALW